jgi:hypothetical protein
MKHILLLLSFLFIARFAEAQCSAAAQVYTNIACYGGCNGVAIAYGIGGSPPYTYSWIHSGGNTATATGLCAGTYACIISDSLGCTATSNQVTITQPPQLVATICSQGNVTCFGQCNGYAVVCPSGGTPPYTYFWSPGGQIGQTATGLCAGNYTVTVVDLNGCTQSATVVVTQPPLLTAVASHMNVSCNGGNDGCANVTASGGTPPYTYLWNTSPPQTTASACNLTAGSYTVTVTDANGCTRVATATITQPQQLNATLCGPVTNVSCYGANNGCAVVCPAGGTPPYTYNWNPSGCNAATCCNLPAGAYTVTVRDANACSSVSVVSITQPPQLTATTSTNSVRCYGQCNGSASVNTNGGIPPYNYLWSPGGQTGQTATGLCAGTYTVTITDANGCTITRTSVITQPQPLNVNVTPLSPTSAYATVNGGTPGYTYTWIPVGQNSPTATGLPLGNYTCCVTDMNGCSTCSPFIMTSVDEYSEEEGMISIYPNPFHSTTTVLLNENSKLKNAELIIYDATGREVQKFKIQNPKVEINGLLPGIYFLKIEGIKNKTVKRLVVY